MDKLKELKESVETVIKATEVYLEARDIYFEKMNSYSEEDQKYFNKFKDDEEIIELLKKADKVNEKLFK